MFNEHQMDPSTLRGFNGPDVTNAPHEPGTHGGNFATNVQYGTHNTNEQHEVYKNTSDLYFIQLSFLSYTLFFHSDIITNLYTNKKIGKFPNVTTFKANQLSSWPELHC